MARLALLIDTDVFIDYLNHGLLSSVFDSDRYEIYYSIVTKKELLSKPGLREGERRAILEELKRRRLIPLSPGVTAMYSDLRRTYPLLEKEDALIAASALTRRLPLVTRNRKHFLMITGLHLVKTIGL